MNDVLLRLISTLAPATALLGILAIAVRRMRGTTLVAPGCWALLAVACVGIVECAATLLPQGTVGWLNAARYCAAVATLLPIIAILGAKRPQDRAWQLIVFSLWAVLSLPAIADLLYHYGQPVSLDTAWRAFLVILVGVGLVNYLPTRNWLASLACAAAQILLVADYLHVSLPVAIEWRTPLALTLAGLAALAIVAWPPRTPNTGERLWRGFRDAYGMLWAVRVRERSQTGASASQQESERTLVAHLQRFVSRKWIDARLADHGDPSNRAR